MLVTIELPVYNNADTLMMTLKSIYAQTLQDWELIIVDDKSTDNTLEIARSIDDPRVTVIENPTNEGVAVRHNQMADYARGKYAAKIDADDLMHPQRLRRQVEYMESHPEVDVLATPVYVIDSAGTIIGIRANESLIQNAEAVLKTGWIYHPTVMAKAEWYRQNRYDPAMRRSQDYELWCRTFKSTRFEKLMEPLTYYRVNHRDPVSYMKTYLRNVRGEREIIRRHGPALVGGLNTRRAIIRTYLKSIFFVSATYLKYQERFVAGKTKPLSEEEMAAAVEGMERIVSQHVITRE